MVVELHAARANQHDIALLQRHVLACQRVLEVLARDPVLVGQHVQTLGRCHVNQHAARHQWREFLNARALPTPITQMLVGAEAVPDPAAYAEVVECVDVRARMAVHGERRARVAARGVHALAHVHGVVHHGAAWRVRHPELVVRIAGVLPAGHAHVVLGSEVIDLAACDALQDGSARGGRYQVQAADLVARPPGAGAHILAGTGRERVATVGMSQAGERCCHHEQQGRQAPDTGAEREVHECFLGSGAPFGASEKVRGSDLAQQDAQPFTQHVQGLGL